MNGYWIYESHPHDKAVVHRGDCLYCSHGTDLQGTRVKNDGKWMGPYGNHAAAWKYAQGSNRKTQISCKHCIRQDD